jgi:hypothetical protein
MPAVSEIFTATKAMLADPAHWTQWTHARDEAGNPVKINSTRAVCFCLDGALAKAAGVHVDAFGHWVRDDQFQVASELLRTVAHDATGRRSYVAVNDGETYVKDETGHPGVLALLDLGIEKARQREEFNWEQVEV